MTNPKTATYSKSYHALAIHFGNNHNMAIALVRILDWIESNRLLKKSRYFFDGRWWTNITQGALAACGCGSIRTIRNIINRLVEMGLIIVRRVSGRANFISVNEAAVNEILYPGKSCRTSEDTSAKIAGDFGKDCRPLTDQGKDLGSKKDQSLLMEKNSDPKIEISIDELIAKLRFADDPSNTPLEESTQENLTLPPESPSEEENSKVPANENGSHEIIEAEIVEVSKEDYRSEGAMVSINQTSYGIEEFSPDEIERHKRAHKLGNAHFKEQFWKSGVKTVRQDYIQALYRLGKNNKTGRNIWSIDEQGLEPNYRKMKNYFLKLERHLKSGDPNLTLEALDQLEYLRTFVDPEWMKAKEVVKENQLQDDIASILAERDRYHAKLKNSHSQASQSLVLGNFDESKNE